MSDRLPQREAGQPGPLTIAGVGLGMAVLVFLVIVGLIVGGEAASFAEAGLQSLPFAPLAIFAYLGVQRRWARYLAFLWLAGLVLAFAVFGLLSGAAALLQPGSLSGTPGLVPGGSLRLVLLFLGNGAAIAIGAVCLAPPVRRALSRFLPIDPDSFVHAVALSAVVAIALLCLLPLAAVGQPPLIAATNLLLSEGGTANLDAAAMLRTTVYGLVWILPVAFFCVGYGVRRNLHQAAARLGLVMPTLRQVAAGVGLAVLLVIGAQALGLALDWLWRTLGWPRTGGEAFDEAFNSLLAAYMSPVGAVVLAVTAGLGEELAVRGVLQPRLGIVLSAIFFASLHAFQYYWDGLLLVLFIGLILGVIRQRSNTTVSAIAHGMYDFILVVIMLLGVSMPGQ
ncbi:MAG: CPBP family intramembrane glutamic endopeptidase [Anaerolineae bacterium]